MPLLLVLYVVLMVVAGSHLVRYRGSNSWLLAVVFLPIVGSLAYIVMVMKPAWLMGTRQRPSVVIERGPYAREYKDPANRVMEEATRRLDEGDPAACRELLSTLDLRPGSRNGGIADLLQARCLEAEGAKDEALAAYKSLMVDFPGEEARCRYALLLRDLGRFDEARDTFREVARSIAKGGRDYLRSEGEWLALARRHLGL